MFRVMVSRKCVLGVVFGAFFVFIAGSAKADTVIYSNLGTYSGYSLEPAHAGTINGSNYTGLLADDITPAAGTAGTPVSTLSIAFTNFNTYAVTFTPILEVFDNNAGYPGAMLYSSALAPTEIDGMTTAVYTVGPGTTPLFTTPASRFWLGLIFSDQGVDPLSTTTLNNLGIGMFNPPTVGSSLDLLFSGNGADSGDLDNLDGKLIFFGGNPVANLGFALPGGCPNRPRFRNLRAFPCWRSASPRWAGW